MKNGELKIYKFLGVIIKLQNGQDKKKSGENLHSQILAPI